MCVFHFSYGIVLTTDVIPQISLTSLPVILCRNRIIEVEAGDVAMGHKHSQIRVMIRCLECGWYPESQFQDRDQMKGTEVGLFGSDMLLPPGGGDFDAQERFSKEQLPGIWGALP